MSWYPNADKSVKGNSAGSFTGGPPKGLLHTTEGSSGSGAIAAFKANNSWPHFMVDYKGKVWQFIDANLSARALRNLPGGVQTNTDSVIQIEIVGFAGNPSGHPVVQMAAIKSLMRWIESNCGVKPIAPPLPFASHYGQPGTRMSPAVWDSYNGWCGHSHCPENDHWDPGMIDLASLLPTPAIIVPGSYFTEVPIVPFTLIRPEGGYIVVGGDGGVFTYEGAPFYGSIPGLGVQAKAVSAAWTPTSLGYWILGEDGGVFTFGDAAYRGGFNALPPAVQGNRKPIGIVAKGSGYLIVTLDPSNDGSPFDGYDFQ